MTSVRYFAVLLTLTVQTASASTDYYDLSWTVVNAFRCAIAAERIRDFDAKLEHLHRGYDGAISIGEAVQEGKLAVLFRTEPMSPYFEWLDYSLGGAFAAGQLYNMIGEEMALKLAANTKGEMLPIELATANYQREYLLLECTKLGE